MGRRLYARRRPLPGARVGRVCEPLEPRMLLSVNISGTTGNDTIALTVGSGGVLQATVNATTTNYTAAQYSGGITIDTRGGTDILNISALPAVQTLVEDEGRLTVNVGTAARGLLDIASTRLTIGNTSNAQEGPITLNVNDAPDTTAHHATISTVTSGNVGDTYNVLHGLSAGDIWFSAFDVFATTLTTGAAANTIDVNSLGEFDAFPQMAQVSTVTLFTSHVGSQVNVGGPIVQPLIVEGIAGSVALTVNEALNQNITLQTAGTVLGNNVLGQLTVPNGFSPGAISFEASAMASAVVINCGNNDNTIQVLGTPTNVTGGNAGPSINLNTGNGSDTVNVLGNGVGIVLNIDGQDGLDNVALGDAGSVQNIKGVVNVTNPLQFSNVTIDDSADATGRTATLSTFASSGSLFDSLAGLAPGTINFKGGDVPAAVVLGGSGGNHFNLTAAAQGTALTFNTGAGDDQVTVSGTAPFGPISLNTQGGDDSVVVDYTAGAIANASVINLNGGAGNNSLRINGASTGGPYTVIAGKITYGTTTLNYSNIAALTLDPATYNINADLGSIALTIASNATFRVTQHLSSLIVLPTGTATVAGTTPFGTTLFLDSSLVIVPGGKLDLTNNQLQLHYAGSAIVEVRALIANAYSGGTWSSWGITTSSADATHGLGFADSADGLIPSLPANTILVRWARYGDLNLDGTVNFVDLLSFAQHYGQLNANWDQGDINYDGNVNFTDLLRLAQNYGGTAAVSALAASPAPDQLLPARRKKPRVA